MQGKKNDAGKRCKIVFGDGSDTETVHDAMLLEKDTFDRSWSVFVFTGDIGYYACILYSEIKEIGDLIKPR